MSGEKEGAPKEEPRDESQQEPVPGTPPDLAAQPELRRDPITAEWVILATGRGKRPHAPAPAQMVDQPDEDCPFCPGHEDRTPPEICAMRRDGEGECDKPGWKVRVIPNRFPILVSGVPRAGVERAVSPDRRPALGTSEVIVDTPVHNQPPWQVGPEQTLVMLEMYRDRINAIKEEGRASYVHIIRNYGAAAASSLEHPHSQLFGLPFIPPTIDVELDGFVFAYPGTAGCVLCDIIEETARTGDRVIMATENFLAFTPYASRLPYESWIVPRKHSLRFEKCEELPELAELMTAVLNRYHDRLGDPPLNYWVHNYPLHGESRPYHWHIEILPRMTLAGGLELGAGVWVNTVAPEDAAEQLR
ncbi:MAG: galactose-1-phosphate uridylyltransferase [Actinobacteria bacterium]|nr:galactose-1-phosphate uridylyltransferase [Actinomycetota bacterium]